MSIAGRSEAHVYVLPALGQVCLADLHAARTQPARGGVGALMPAIACFLHQTEATSGGVRGKLYMEFIFESLCSRFVCVLCFPFLVMIGVGEVFMYAVFLQLALYQSYFSLFLSRILYLYFARGEINVFGVCLQSCVPLCYRPLTFTV